MGEKQIEKLKRGIDEFRKSAGRFRIDEAEESAERVIEYLMAFAGVERVTPAGSLRRGRETAGDLDLLVTGPACEPERVSAIVDYTAAYPGIRDMICEGREQSQLLRLANSLRGGCAIACRQALTLSSTSQYFTGSPKMHSAVALRQRALSRWAIRLSE